MLDTIIVNNYKSIKKLHVNVGQFNVLIGENGAGKSNFLEVLASYSAILENSFSNEFLLSRGIRVTESKDMFTCFKKNASEKISFRISDSMAYGCNINISLNNDEPFSPLNHEIELLTPNFGNSENNIQIHNIKDLTFPKIYEKFEKLWENHGSFENFIKYIEETTDKIKATTNTEVGLNNLDINQFDDFFKVISKFQTLNEVKKIADKHNEKDNDSKISDFIIFSPELSSLRVFSKESQIEPLGVNGEGLLKLLQVMQEHEPENLKKVCETVEVFQWVEKIIIEKDDNINLDHRIKIIDRYMGREIDHRSANEGFLFVLFYAALFSSKFTPKCFAVDNIDASLNPKLCRVLIKELIKLTKENGKQAFVTTHNPAILDGLDLRDDKQRLFVVERNEEGATQLRRVGVDDLPKPTRSGQTLRLSESFMRGFLGGLPTNFM